MKREQAIDLSDVEMKVVREGESDLDAEVTTKHGVARLTMDISADEYVGVSVVLPSGNVYKTKIDSWANDVVDDETEEGRASILRLCAAFVVQCFEKDINKWN